MRLRGGGHHAGTRQDCPAGVEEQGSSSGRLSHIHTLRVQAGHQRVLQVSRVTKELLSSGTWGGICANEIWSQIYNSNIRRSYKNTYLCWPYNDHSTVLFVRYAMCIHGITKRNAVYNQKSLKEMLYPTMQRTFLFQLRCLESHIYKCLEHFFLYQFSSYSNI